MGIQYFAKLFHANLKFNLSQFQYFVDIVNYFLPCSTELELTVS